MLDRIKRAPRPGRFGLAAIPVSLLVAGLVLANAGSGAGEPPATTPQAAAEQTGLQATQTPTPEPAGETDTSEHGVQKTPVQPIDPFELSGVGERTSETPGSEITLPVTRSWPFVWPANGQITSYMGPEHPWGIDIGLRLDKLSLIYATAAGTVSFAGGGVDWDYGYHVMVEHGDGVVTLYAHLSEILVEEGQAVEQGQLLGLGGATGKATGKHLHFEVRDGDSQIDPFDVLPDPSRIPGNLVLSCADSSLVIDQGSTARLDFQDELPNGASLIGVSLQPVSERPDAPPVETRIEDGRYVLVVTHTSMRGAPEDDRFQLLITRSSALGDETLECDVQVHAVEVAPSYYVRVYPPADIVEPTETPLPPTKTPTKGPPTLTPTFTPTTIPTPTITPIPTATRIPTITPIPRKR